ncbi:rRNA methyltransferase 3, mitochondrial-like [Centruroides sculpturatus]|uniref:rRNA methyltransferase 3, mitochondrial-like n=1 Tax=Centruroides sculpturatus TaxID=218467 RepID=UPI000C6DFF7D|nr:rRNA methyltransferase 3, mitochondrial-like [Centruroides sculpturatus]
MLSWRTTSISRRLPSISKYCFESERSYRKGLRRKPIDVITEDGSKESVEPLTKSEVMAKLKREIELKNRSKRTREMVEAEIPPYEKLGDNSQPFVKVMTLLKSRKQREKAGKILLEGKRLINDAITAGAEIETIFFSKEENLHGIHFKKIPHVKIMKVFYKQLSLWSDLTTAPGLMGVFKEPNKKNIVYLNKKKIPLTVICDNVRDPGNLGTILRSGAAIGCQNIILMKGCVDVWDPKVLRSGCGAHFRVPIVNNVCWNIVNTYIPENAKVYLADNRDDVQRENFFQNFSSEKVIEVKEGEKLIIDETYEDKNELQKFKYVHLPQYNYTDVTYDDKCVLLIGGETEGLSNEAKKLACEYEGCRVKIPVENDVESLNSAISMAVIGFEIKRQLLSGTRTR